MNSFRRPGKSIHSERRDWDSWIDSHSGLVAAADLPSSAIETEDAWWYFLDRTYTQAGYLGTDIWFDVGTMTADQRCACMTLIEQWIAERATDLAEHTTRALRITFGPSQNGG
ncbi:MAG: hypothetical protein Aurels2KO_53280 [Aureliella sp.]